MTDSAVGRWATGSPLDLAVFRVTVSVVVLGSVDVWEAHTWARAAVAAPPGWPFPPPTELTATLATAVVVIATLLTLIGLFTRIASTIAALSLTWLLAVPQFSGQVLHTHHLAWLFALVAASPSGDALSLDARRARRPCPAPSLAHGLPVRFAWLTIGLIFFFPGAWKLHGGAAWLDALPALVEWKRFQLGLSLPSPWPATLVKLGGALTIALELGVGVLLLFRKTRLVAVLATLSFHLAVQVVMGIGFSSLWACYLVFGDWAKWLKPTEGPAVPRGVVVPLVAGGALTLAMVVAGVTGREDAWPIACYPTFRHPAPSTVRWVEIETDDAHLRLADLRRAQRWWALSTKVAANPTREALEQLHRQWRGEVRPARYFLLTWSPGDAAPVKTER